MDRNVNKDHMVQIKTVGQILLQPPLETEGKGKNRSQRVVIHYRFIGILDYPQNEPAYTADTRKGVAVKYVTKSA